MKIRSTQPLVALFLALAAAVVPVAAGFSLASVIAACALGALCAVSCSIPMTRPADLRRVWLWAVCAAASMLLVLTGTGAVHTPDGMVVALVSGVGTFLAPMYFLVAVAAVRRRLDPGPRRCDHDFVCECAGQTPSAKTPPALAGSR